MEGIFLDDPIGLAIKLAIFFIIYWIIRLISRLPFTAIFTGNNSFWQIITISILAKLEPFMLNNASPRSFSIGIVNSCVTLEVGLVQYFIFKTHAAVLQIA